MNKQTGKTINAKLCLLILFEKTFDFSENGILKSYLMVDSNQESLKCFLSILKFPMICRFQLLARFSLLQSNQPEIKFETRRF